MEERGIPNLGDELLAYRRLCGRSSGVCQGNWAAAENLADPARVEVNRDPWTAADEALDVQDGMARVVLPPAGAEGYTAICLDLGQLGVGTLQLDITGAAGGDVVDCLFVEGADENGRPSLPADRSAGCYSSFASRLICRPGRTRHELFHMIGHRFLVVMARQTAQPLRVGVSLRHTVYPLEITGRFACSDELLNDIYRISVRTQQVCMLDAYVDTPWREQAQWWGDARVQGMNTFHLAGDDRLLVRGIRSLARQEVPNGLTYGHAPTMSHWCILPDFTLIWILTIWDHYWQTGSTELFVELWDRIERALGYFEGECLHASGLLGYDRRYWLFLDWTDIHKNGAPTLLNLWYLLTLQKLAILAAKAGLTRQRRRLKEMAARQEALVLDKLWDARQGLFHDGLDEKGKPVARCSLHNQTLAIFCGLEPKRQDAMIQNRLLPYLRGESVESALPSSYWVTYVYDVMEARGYGAEVVEHIRRHWAPMVATGGCWETFSLKLGYGTTSHAWAAHPIYHLARTLGGLTQTSPGWSHVRFEPAVAMAQVNEAEAAIPTPHGLIRCGWTRQDAKVLKVNLSLPKGVTAEVYLPGQAVQKATGRKTWRLAL